MKTSILTIFILLFFLQVNGQSNNGKIISSYYYWWHPTTSNINLKEGQLFEKTICPILICKKYKGTYKIQNNQINFYYYKDRKPINELSYGLLTDSSIIIYETLTYKRCDFLDKHGKLRNGVDSTLFGKTDTITRVYKRKR